VAIDGVAFNQSQLGVCRENRYALEFLCWYVPEFSVLWRPFVVWTAPGANAWLIAAFCLVSYAVVSAPLLPSLAAEGRSVWGKAFQTARKIRF
jgi:hypothetical protein